MVYFPNARNLLIPIASQHIKGSLHHKRGEGVLRPLFVWGKGGKCFIHPSVSRRRVRDSERLAFGSIHPLDNSAARPTHQNPPGAQTLSRSLRMIAGPSCLSYPLGHLRYQITYIVTIVSSSIISS
jgi:hypothetical protein